MLWYLPIEPLEERYSKQWYEWFPEEFERQGIIYQTIDGETLCDTVEVGTFLDINSTMHYKASQIRKISALFHQNQIQDGDVFFLSDTEMFGMEGTIRYLADLNGLANIRIYGFAHAGSYTREDFVEPCARYAKSYEHAWSDIFDQIFVGSEYHKNRLKNLRGVAVDKITVTGNPYDVEQVRNSISPQVKINRVIHTNRPDPEKRPNLTLDLFEKLKQNHSGWEFMVTTGRRQWGTGALRERALRLQEQGVITVCEGISKFAYLTLLAQSKVMTGNTVEEMFGYCLLESLIFDTIPIVKNAFSHPELVQWNRKCLFNFDQETQIERAMEHPFRVSHYASQYQVSLSKIVEHLK